MQWSVAALAVFVVAVRPRSWACAAAVAALAGLDLLAGAGTLGEALRATAPMVAVLVVALGVATTAVRLGLADRAARMLSLAARGRTWILFAHVCLLTAVLTMLVSLDGAVVLMAPVVVALGGCLRLPLRPFVLGVVAMANASSLAVPTGNPTNLVVLERLGTGLGHATARTALPAVTAALLCVCAVGWTERQVLAGRHGEAIRSSGALGKPAGWGGVSRAALQVLALLLVLLPVLRHARLAPGPGLPGLLAVALLVSIVSALANNLPASALVAAGLAPGPAVYAALIGLSVGALATPQGSVATLIAEDLTHTRSHSWWLLPAALAATVAATVVLWLAGA